MKADALDYHSDALILLVDVGIDGDHGIGRADTIVPSTNGAGCDRPRAALRASAIRINDPSGVASRLWLDRTSVRGPSTSEASSQYLVDPVNRSGGARLTNADGDHAIQESVAFRGGFESWERAKVVARAIDDLSRPSAAITSGEP